MGTIYTTSEATSAQPHPPSSTTPNFERPWFALLSENHFALATGLVILSSMTWAIGATIKNITAAIICYIFGSSTFSDDCNGLPEALAEFALVTTLTLIAARLVLSSTCFASHEPC